MDIKKFQLSIEANYPSLAIQDVYIMLMDRFFKSTIYYE